MSFDFIFDENNVRSCNSNFCILAPLALDKNNFDTFSTDNNEYISKYEHIAYDMISCGRSVIERELFSSFLFSDSYSL